MKPEQIVSFIRCISLLMLTLIGAREYHAEIQGMDPKSDAYLRWVKKQIMFITVPMLNSFELKPTTRDNNKGSSLCSDAIESGKLSQKNLS
jgi:hypothetical protein